MNSMGKCRVKQTADSVKDIHERLRKMGLIVRAGSEIQPPKKNECWRCGACCCAYPDLPPFTPDEVEALPKDIKYIVKWFRARRLHGVFNVCQFLHTDHGMRCMIYENRPKICRDFKPGGRDCLDCRLPSGRKLSERLRHGCV